MNKIVINAEYFNVKDTLSCGQIFRFFPYKKGYVVTSLDKRAYAYNEGENAVIECEDGDTEYFENFFDLKKDYSGIYLAAKKEGGIIAESAKYGKGIRILKQNAEETLYSFIVSQNNNIPRIKGIIEKLCAACGEEKTFLGEKFYSFPKSIRLAEKDISFFCETGLGYRAPYIKKLAENIKNGENVEEWKNLPTTELKNKVLSVYGVGEKVADCVTLFGFNRSDSFPVDVWIERVYREDMRGEIKDRKKISRYLSERYGANAGYFQQYLFYYKREREKV